MSESFCCRWRNDGETLPLLSSKSHGETYPVTNQPRSGNYVEKRSNNELECERLRADLIAVKRKLEQQETRYLEDIDQRNSEIQKLKEDLAEFESRNEELLTRLSATASAKLTDNNPNIADLADVNRPTKLADMFSELYDNEWTDAFEKLKKAKGDEKTEKEVCELLVHVLSVIFSTCFSKATDDLRAITESLSSFNGMTEQSKEVLKALKNDRKMNYRCVIQKIKKEVKDSLKEIISEQKANLIGEYIEKCITICWLMAIQDPPVYMEIEADFHNICLNTDKYKYYTKTGPMIDFIIWPVLYLSKGGNILSKGVAQGMEKEKPDSEAESLCL